MTAPKHVQHILTGKDAEEDERLEVETSEPSGSEPMPVQGVATGAVSGFTGTTMLAQHLRETTGQAATDRKAATGKELSDLADKKPVSSYGRNSMLTQHLRETTGQAATDRKAATGKELSDLADKKPVSSYGRNSMLTQHLRETTGQAATDRKAATGKELSDLADKKPVSSYDRNSMLTQQLLENTGRAGRERRQQSETELEGIRARGKLGTLIPKLNSDHPFSKRIGERKERGPDFDPSAHLAEQRRIREEQKAAKEKVDEKLPKLAPYIEAARAAAAGGIESADLVQFDAHSASKDWISALADLEHLAVVSKAALQSAYDEAMSLKPLGARIGKAPKCHQPTGLQTMWGAITESHKQKRWLTMGSQVSDFRGVVEQAIGFIDNLVAIRERAGQLKHPAQADNMKRFLAKHEEMTWEQVVESQHNTHVEGSIAYLEDRLKRYEGNTAAAEAAAAALQEKQENGLIGGNGREIRRKSVDDFGAEEKAAIENALAAYDTETQPVLSHPNGMQWAAPHRNRRGDLPGTAGAGGYKEYYVEKAPNSLTYHGNRRLVVHNKKKWIYYSWTHYGDNGSPAFVRIR